MAPVMAPPTMANGGLFVLPKITLKTIAAQEQRYQTVGDWLYVDDGVEVRATWLDNDDYTFLILIHELIEWYLCTRKG
jgi:hypothetical protein